ncbi:MAG: N-acetylmuramoyl-L-alanine amidase, partial [Bacteroidota bacterium]
MSFAVLTAAPVSSSPGGSGFNASLKGGEDTRRLTIDERRLTIDEGATASTAHRPTAVSPKTTPKANEAQRSEWKQRQLPRQSSIVNRQSSIIKRVVIDAGHGGKDPGGMGANSQEKHIALRIAQLLSIGIRTNFPDVEVILTRNDDTFIPLHERAEIANKAGADLFVSIHANIMPGSSATRGTETFVMGQHVAQHNLDVAKRENASILLEGGDVKTNYGFDPNSDEGHILMSMFQHAYLERSIQFAELVEREFAAAGRKSRGVKQAGFVVLKKTTMPAVLVETGFMSNPTEEAYLLSDAGQQKLANALLRAFGTYYKVTGGERVYADLTEPLTFSPAQVSKAPQAVAPKPAPGKNTVFGKEIDLSDSPTPARQRQWTAKGVSDTPLTYQRTPSVYHYVPPVPTEAPVAAPSPVTQPYRPSPAEQQAALLRRQVTAPNAVNNRVVPGTPARPGVYGTPVSTTAVVPYTARGPRPAVSDSVPG